MVPSRHAPHTTTDQRSAAVFVCGRSSSSRRTTANPPRHGTHPVWHGSSEPGRAPWQAAWGALSITARSGGACTLVMAVLLLPPDEELQKSAWRRGGVWAIVAVQSCVHRGTGALCCCCLRTRERGWGRNHLPAPALDANHNGVSSSHTALPPPRRRLAAETKMTLCSAGSAPVCRVFPSLVRVVLQLARAWSTRQQPRSVTRQGRPVTRAAAPRGTSAPSPRRPPPSQQQAPPAR